MEGHSDDINGAINVQQPNVEEKEQEETHATDTAASTVIGGIKEPVADVIQQPNGEKEQVSAEEPSHDGDSLTAEEQNTSNSGDITNGHAEGVDAGVAVAPTLLGNIPSSEETVTKVVEIGAAPIAPTIVHELEKAPVEEPNDIVSKHEEMKPKDALHTSSIPEGSSIYETTMSETQDNESEAAIVHDHLKSDGIMEVDTEKETIADTKAVIDVHPTVETLLDSASQIGQDAQPEGAPQLAAAEPEEQSEQPNVPAVHEDEAQEPLNHSVPEIEVDGEPLHDDIIDEANEKPALTVSTSVGEPTDRPKSPWTPSYSVTVMGRGVTGNDEDVEEIEQLPEQAAQHHESLTQLSPPGGALDSIIVQNDQVQESSKTNVQAGADLPSKVEHSVPEERGASSAADQAALSDGHNSPYIQSYSVSRQGSRSDLRATYVDDTAVAEAPVANVIVTESEEAFHHNEAPVQPSPPDEAVSNSHVGRVEALDKSDIQDEPELCSKAEDLVQEDPAIATAIDDVSPSNKSPYLQSYSVSHQGSKSELHTTYVDEGKVTESVTASIPVTEPAAAMEQPSEEAIQHDETPVQLISREESLSTSLTEPEEDSKKSDAHDEDEAFTKAEGLGQAVPAMVTITDVVAPSDAPKSPYPQSYSVSHQGSRSELNGELVDDANISESTVTEAIVTEPAADMEPLPEQTVQSQESLVSPPDEALDASETELEQESGIVPDGAEMYREVEEENTAQVDSLSDGRKPSYPQSYSVLRQGSRSDLRDSYVHNAEASDSTAPSILIVSATEQSSSILTEPESSLTATEIDDIHESTEHPEALAEASSEEEHPDYATGESEEVDRDEGHDYMELPSEVEDSLPEEPAVTDEPALSDGRKSPYPQSYSVSRQGSRSNLRAGFINEGAVSESTVLPKTMIIEPATYKARSITSEALSSLAASQGDGVVADSTSDVSARSDMSEAAMSPRSELSSITTGFDSRSEVSAASHEPNPGTPRTDISDIPSIWVDTAPDDVTSTPTKLPLPQTEDGTPKEDWEATTPLVNSLLVFPAQQPIEDKEEETEETDVPMSRDVTVSPVLQHIKESVEELVEDTDVATSKAVSQSEDFSQLENASQSEIMSGYIAEDEFSTAGGPPDSVTTEATEYEDTEVTEAEDVHVPIEQPTAIQTASEEELLAPLIVSSEKTFVQKEVDVVDEHADQGQIVPTSETLAVATEDEPPVAAEEELPAPVSGTLFVADEKIVEAHPVAEQEADSEIVVQPLEPVVASKTPEHVEKEDHKQMDTIPEGRAEEPIIIDEQHEPNLQGSAPAAEPGLHETDTLPVVLDEPHSSAATEVPGEEISLSQSESEMEAVSESELPAEDNDMIEGISELSSIHGGSSQVGASVTSDFPASYSTFTLRTIDDDEDETGTIQDLNDDFGEDTSVQDEVVDPATSQQKPSVEVESVAADGADGSSSELVMPEQASDKTVQDAVVGLIGSQQIPSVELETVEPAGADGSLSGPDHASDNTKLQEFPSEAASEPLEAPTVRPKPSLTPLVTVPEDAEVESSGEQPSFVHEPPTRQRLESIKSISTARFFPGGWVTAPPPPMPERPSTEYAQGVFTPSQSPVSQQSQKKARCVIM